VSQVRRAAALAFIPLPPTPVGIDGAACILVRTEMVLGGCLRGHVGFGWGLVDGDVPGARPGLRKLGLAQARPPRNRTLGMFASRPNRVAQPLILWLWVSLILIPDTSQEINKDLQQFEAA